jgi:hypothetical protein
LNYKNWQVIVPSVVGIFFPLREDLGFDARQFTPVVIRKMVRLAAETRSYARAVIALEEADVEASAKTVERVVLDVGAELAARRDANPKSSEALALAVEDVPDLAVAECDGGRIRCREPGHGPGVHLDGKGWREDKNACLIRAQRQTFDSDPQPEPPASFCDPQHVAKIAETEALSVASLRGAESVAEENNWVQAPSDEPDWRPKRLVRTVLSSMANSDEFGRQMQREAKRRNFFKAAARAFLGDGLPWNWSIWKEHFSTFTPILDFIHPLSYLFTTAKAVHPTSPEDAWNQYMVWMTGCWRGEVGQVLDEMKVWQTKLGVPPDDAEANDPRQVLSKSIGYLENNRNRMDYPSYRKQGLPITTAWMESLVKEINYRVKGTEMYWNNPEGAEAILQVRAAALSDDDRLRRHLQNRPGCPLTRRPKQPKLPSEKIKS